MTIPKITSVSQLVRNLNMGGGYDGYESILQSIYFAREELNQYCHWSHDHHTRISLTSMDSYELLLVCWENGQQTTIHDYNDSEGWIYMIEGELQEEHYSYSKVLEELQNRGTQTLSTGQLAYENAYGGLHRFSNKSGARAISLHLYAGPIKVWNEFNEATRTMEQVPVKSNFSIEVK